MKPQTKAEMMEFGATEQEAENALKLFEVLRPALKINRENGRIPTTHGDKTVLGFYRTVKGFTNPAAPEPLVIIPPDLPLRSPEEGLFYLPTPNTKDEGIYVTKGDLVALLRANKNNPEAVQYLADMLE